MASPRHHFWNPSSMAVDGFTAKYTADCVETEGCLIPTSSLKAYGIGSASTCSLEAAPICRVA